jgi:hypothetical protein
LSMYSRITHTLWYGGILGVLVTSS